MGKGHRNQPNPGFFKVQGGSVEERSATRAAKQALAGEKTRTRMRAGAKNTLGEAPPEQRRAEPSPALTHPAAPRRGTRNVTTDAAAWEASRLGAAAHRVARVVGYARFAFSTARAVIDRVRHRDRS